MNNSNSIPRAQGDAAELVDISIGTFNKLADMVEQSRLTVTAPLFLQSMPGCTMIGIAGPLAVRPLILRSVDTGAGFYKGDWQDGSPVVANGSNGLSLPFTGHRAGSNSRVLVFNPSENNKTGHALNPTTGAEIYVAALTIGRTSENPSREVAMLLGSNSPSTGQYQGMVFQMVTQNVTGWDFVASHAIDT